MGILSFLERSSVPGLFAGSNIEDPSSNLAAPAAWLLDSLGARPSSAGVNVSPKTALSYSPAAACIRVLAETVATVETVLIQRVGERQVRRNVNHIVHEIVSRKFNENLLAFNGMMNMQGHLGGWGNAYAEIAFDSKGYPAGLYPLLPDRTYPQLFNGQKIIRTTVGTEPVALPASRVLHLHGWGYDGLQGYSPIRLATQGIGLGMAAEEFGSRWFSGGSRPSGFLTSDKPIKQERADRIKASFEMLHQGLSQSHRVAVLEDGLKFEALTVNPEDAQLLQTRKFQVEEQCRWYRMAPHMIQHVESGGAKANMAQQALEFVQFTMMTWFVNWEQSLTDALLSPKEITQGYRVRFLLGGLLRGDLKSQAEAIAILRQWGVYCADDARALLDENELPNGTGKAYLVPMNMISAEVAANWKPTAPDEPTPKPAKPNPAPASPSKQGFALQERYRARLASVVEQAASRYVRVEVNHARAALKRIPSGGIEAFLAEMEKLWGAKLEAQIQAELRPGLSVLGALIAEATADLAGHDAPKKTAEEDGDPEPPAASGSSVVPPEVESVVTAQIRAASRLHLDTSRREIFYAVEGPAESVADRLAELLTCWEFNRPSAIAMAETTTLSAQVAGEIYRLGGFAE
jgi:HK97 family phage portal protein